MAKSNLARGASMAASVWLNLDAAVRKNGGTENALHLLGLKEGEELLNGIANMIVWAELKTRFRFPVTIDYSKTLDEMIAECGCGYNDSNITVDNFPITGHGVVEEEIVLVHFNDQHISNDDIIIELNKMGLEPAGLVHALAFGKAHPNIQRWLSTFFFGSSCVMGKKRNFPCLGGSNSGRGLNLDWFSNGGGDRRRFAAVRKSAPPDRFPVTIDYSLSLEQMITECGCDSTNQNITSANFPITGQGVVKEEVILVHFNKYISSKDAIEELAKMGLEPAGLVHALAFGKKYPDKQREFLIVFFGSYCSVGGECFVPYLTRMVSKRGLDLNYFDRHWSDTSRFAAVRKPSPDQFPITIDYSKTLDQMIAECGCNHIHQKITAANFSITGKGVVKEEVILVPFNRYISSKDAIAELTKMGLEPARIEHALAFEKKYPDVQCKQPIVFLGSSCEIDGRRGPPYLDACEMIREFGVGYSDSDWLDDCLFAAVQAKKS